MEKERNMVRLLKASEIECRVSVINENGLSLLLYKDARVDQKILDETFGTFGWQRSHQCIDGSLYCTVAVYDRESGAWVAKQDVGVPGYAEKEKSQASDSFKRACFNWGIGRELYTAPFIWLPSSLVNIQNKGNKLYCSDHFSVESIEYNGDREITGLEIVNGRGKTVYRMEKAESGNRTVKNGIKDGINDVYGENNGKIAGGKKGAENTAALKRQEEEFISQIQMDLLEAELERTGVEMDAVKERYRINTPETMGSETYKKIMAALAKTKTSEAA